jgi:hypothetical protein
MDDTVIDKDGFVVGAAQGCGHPVPSVDQNPTWLFAPLSVYHVAERALLGRRGAGLGFKCDNGSAS